MNQVISKGKDTFHYDLNGNLIKQSQTGKTIEYTYDALDRLIAVTQEGKVAKYHYDPFNRRLSKNLDGQEELFVYQGQEEIGRWKEGAFQELRLLGENRQCPMLAMEIKGIPYTPIHDISGNIVCLLDHQGKVIESYRYTVFGESEIHSPSNQPRDRSTIGNPWQYAGKRLDEETGLVAFGLRYYDPSLGRWITPDPAGFEDGSNLYAYLHNSPFKHYDQFGEFADWRMGALGIGGIVGECWQDYKSFCIPITNKFSFNDPAFPIQHIDIETKLERDYNFRKKDGDPPFERTASYCVNDFIDPETGQNYNFPDLPANKLAVYMNGICTTRSKFEESMGYLGKLTGYNIKGVHSVSHGFITDALCYIDSRNNLIAFEGVRELHKVLNEFYTSSSADATSLLIDHSRGAVYARNFLMDYPPNLRYRVEILSIAPGAYTDENLCRSVQHYASSRDGVPYLDYAGRQRCRGTLTILEPHPDAPWFDHSIMSPTYTEHIEKHAKKYFNK